MADSVDRVFGHALNTVNKIRTGSQKPPVASRLRLYGLYKQSMEGDVSYVQSRPSGPSESSKKEAEKWDAWNANTGLSRTEAKKRYIETLIETMHTYASTTPEARELVGELEFVWDQVRNNSQASGSSGSGGGSPAQLHERVESGYPGMVGSRAAAFETTREKGDDGKGKMRVLSPTGENDVARKEEDGEEEREEFVDAPVSQYGEQELESPEGERAQDTLAGASDERGSDSQPRRTTAGDAKWRRRIETALVKMTTEVAALREQLESRRFVSQQRRHSLAGWILRFGWFLVRAVVVDVFILWIVLLYLRRKRDRRLEGAVRVLLGDAVAQISKASNQIKVPKLPTRK